MSNPQANKYSKYLSESKFEINRNLAYAGAGISLLLILLIIQIWKPTTELKIGLYSAIIAAPLFLLLGSIYEFYILIGEKSYSHFWSRKTQLIVIGSGGIGSIGILISLSSLIYGTHQVAVIYLAASALIALAALFVFIVDFTKATRDHINEDA